MVQAFTFLICNLSQIYLDINKYSVDLGFFFFFPQNGQQDVSTLFVECYLIFMNLKSIPFFCLYATTRLF